MQAVYCLFQALFHTHTLWNFFGLSCDARAERSSQDYEICLRWGETVSIPRLQVPALTSGLCLFTSGIFSVGESQVCRSRDRTTGFFLKKYQPWTLSQQGLLDLIFQLGKSLSVHLTISCNFWSGVGITDADLHQLERKGRVWEGEGYSEYKPIIFPVSNCNLILDYWWRNVKVLVEAGWVCGGNIQVFVALLMMGIVRLPAIADYWSRHLGHNFYQEVVGISRNRFFALHKCWRWVIQQQMRRTSEAKKVMTLSWRYEWLLNIWRIAVYMEPSSSQASLSALMNECLGLIKGRHGAKQYVPCKPEPYGFKVQALCDSETG